MSNSLAEADSKIKELLGTTSYVGVPLGRAFRAPSTTAKTRLDREYFNRANALASQELLRNNELALRTMCFPNSAVWPLSSPEKHFGAPGSNLTRSKRSFDEAFKVAELGQLGTKRKLHEARG